MTTTEYRWKDYAEWAQGNIGKHPEWDRLVWSAARELKGLEKRLDELSGPSTPEASMSEADGR